MKKLDELIEVFGKLPGIGKKSAMRIAFDILEKNEIEIENILSTIKDAYTSIKHCSICGNLRDMFLAELPAIKRSVLTDIQAIYDGDPAAKSKPEVVIAYPGFYAIFIYRIAHVLYNLGVPYIPRLMSEYAHEKTGIDINPGATIGDYFCIDHGTGVVIGETAVLGHHVKLYQGVTLGAKSFKVNENGELVKGIKRHPNIGNNVVIYANATVLGGDTVIGDGCVIGASVWITKSVEAGTTVYFNPNK